MISVITLIIVFLLIAVRQIGKLRIKIWHSMLLGALVVLVTGQISLSTAVKSIDPDVMLFLFGIFIVGQALEDSGYLSYLSFKYFSRVKSLSGLIFVILYGKIGRAHV
jgi:Na+/H+ antiporter NhaD/arsenite permease-like protein